VNALRTTRRASGAALIVGWAATIAVGIGTLRADTGRGAVKGVAVEVLAVGVALAATAANVGSRILQAVAARRDGREADEVLADKLAWALELGQDIADAHPRLPAQRPAGETTPARRG